MTLNEYIKRLQELKKSGFGDLPVAVADWRQQFHTPSVKDASNIRVANHQKTICGMEDFGETLVIIGGYTGMRFSPRVERERKEKRKQKRVPQRYTIVGSGA